MDENIENVENSEREIKNPDIERYECIISELNTEIQTLKDENYNIRLDLKKLMLNTNLQETNSSEFDFYKNFMK